MSILKANRIENLTTTDGGINVNNSGNVGVGTAAATGRMLHVSGTGTAVQIDSSNTSNLIKFTNSAASVGFLGYQSDNLVFYTNNSERLRIDSSGRLLLGTTTEGVTNADTFTLATSGHAGMTIRSGASHDGQIAFSDGTSGDAEYQGQILYNHSLNYMRFQTGATERVRIDSSGRVLIGTLTATKNADRLSGNALALVDVGSSNYPSVVVTGYSNASADAGPIIEMQKSRGASDGSMTVVASNDRLGSFQFLGSDGTNFIRAAEIVGQVDGTPGSNDMPGRLVFQTTADGASSPTERMRIDSSGRVGIGTSSPTTPLSVRSSSSITTYGSVSAQFSDNSTGTLYVQHSSGKVQLGSDSALTFGSGTSATERVRIDSSGRVLIGLTSFPDNDAFVIRGNANDDDEAFMSLVRGSAPVGDQNIGMLSFHGNGNQTEAARITVLRDGGTWTAGSSHPGRLVFSTTQNGSSSPSERMRITSGSSNGADFFLNCTSSPSTSVGGSAIKPNGPNGNYYLSMTTSNGAFNHAEFGNGNGIIGWIRTDGSTTSYNTSSDYRLKENVVDLNGAITRVKQLAPKRFNFIADDSKTVDGFLAHEAATVVPEAVTGAHNEVDDDGNAVMQGIDQSKLVPLLTAALQEAIGKIETLETQNTAQQTQINDLLSRVTALETAS